MIKYIGLALVAVIVGVAAAFWVPGTNAAQPTIPQIDTTPRALADVPKPKARPMFQKKQYPAPPEMQIDTEKQYTATIDTSKGTIVLELYPKAAPKTVNNFVFLARESFYDGITFHRVIANFMIQSGDPTATGGGGPGYRFEDEFKGNPHKFDKPGVLAMANAGPNTNGSQFFITHVPTPHLDGKHTIFGQVTEGQDVVNAIRQGDTINSVKIEEK